MESSLKTILHVSLLILCHCNQGTLGCMDGWVEKLGNCYYFSTDSLNWQSARERCQSWQGDLASIGTVEVRDVLTDAAGSTTFWVGMSDIRQEGVWEWTDGTPWDNSIRQWGGGQPDNSGNEDCGHFNWGGHWNDARCGSGMRYVCQISGIPDPCNNYQEINDFRRSTSYISDSVIMNDALGCDNTLSRKWYRFTSAAGGQIPESPPSGNYSCNTRYPIWINGKHPQAGLVVNVIGCRYESELNNCAAEYPVTVRNCGGYFIYNLYPTSNECSDPEMYCAGYKSKCTNGTSSLNNDEMEPCTECQPGTQSVNQDGLQPCSDSFPSPVMNVTMHLPRKQNNQVIFECSVIPELNPTYPVQHEFVYLVRQPGIQDPASEVEIKRITSTANSTFIMDTDLVNKGISLGKEIFCRVTARFIQQSSAPSKAISSNYVFIGMTIMTDGKELMSGENKINVTFHLSVPLVCDTSACQITLYFGFKGSTNVDETTCNVDEVVHKQCFIYIEGSDGTEVTRELELTVGGSPIHSYTSIYTMNVFTSFVYRPPLWRNYNIGELEIPIHHTSGEGELSHGICSSINDPHMTTFDKCYYHNYQEGLFLMYRNTEYKQEVYTRTIKCNRGYASCTCLVAVRVDDDLWVVDLCRERSVKSYSASATSTETFRERKVTLFQNGELSKGFHLKRMHGSTLKVTLPTGTIVTIMDGWPNLLNVQIKASSLDKPRLVNCETEECTEGTKVPRTEGLCGVFDDENNGCNKEELKFGPSEEVEDQCFTAGNCNGRVLEHFPNSWLNDTDFIYNGLPPSPDVDTVQQCMCDEGGELQCESVDECETITPMRRKRDASESFSDDIYPTNDDYESEDNDATNINETIATNPTWPTASGWTQNQAETFCRDSVEASSAKDVADQLTKPLDIDTYISDCIEDIKQSGGTEWLEGTLESLRSAVEQIVIQNASMWTTNDYDKPVGPPTNLLANLCPRDCSGNGLCEKSVCVCNGNYGGPDCSLLKSTAPKVLFIPGKGLCDTRRRLCRTTPIMGNGFIESDNLTCLVRHIQIRKDGSTFVTEELTATKAHFESYQRILCPLPENRVKRETETLEIAASGYRVEVSNDGSVTSDSIDLVSYDSLCMECTGYGSTNCVEKVGACMIGGNCYANLQSHPSNNCLICNVTQNSTNWTEDLSKCLVDGQCFAESGFLEDEPCMTCQPTLTRSRLSAMPSCVAIVAQLQGYEIALIVIGVILAGVIAAVVIILVMKKTKVPPKVDPIKKNDAKNHNDNA